MTLPQRWIRFIAVTISFAVILTAYNNCSGVHSVSEEGSFSSLSACKTILIEDFSKGFYPFVRSNCSNCHSSGPGSGFFASNNLNLSFNAFSKKTAEKISQFATSNHKTPYTGTQHRSTINIISQNWEMTKSKYSDCQIAEGNPDLDLPTTPTPTKRMIAKDANPDLNKTISITWNTETEFLNTKDSFKGGQFVLTVRGVTIADGGPAAYQFENLRFINSSAKPAYVNALSILVNGQKIPGDTFLFAERYIPNIPGNNSRRLTAGVNFFTRPSDIAPGQPLKIQLVIGILSEAEIDFKPVTFDKMVAPDGFFNKNCMSCHGGNGGLTFALDQYINIVGRTANSDKILVSPFTLLDNFIYSRINAEDSFMPPTGKVPVDERDRVRDWILDGAPLNDAAIAK